MPPRTVLLVGFLLVGACGGGDDDSGAPVLFGMYVIDSHTESVADAEPATCLGPGSPVTPTFLELSPDDFGEFVRLAWALCDADDASFCHVPDFYTFEDIDGAWTIGAATSASFSGGGCSLFHAEGGVTVERPDPLAIRLELKEWDELQPIDESQCTLDAAGALAAQDACERHVIITASEL